ncbi:MAG: class I SAM-dependent methyltransferase [Deinococcus-Thermus bacterium]|jgi:16S rRNA (guanine1516-N2)-methyltransferase|nr:class I SAM-dependent methyltransferase [Deinococcota bacterium]
MSSGPAVHARVTADPGLEARGRDLAARLDLPFGAVPARVELRWTAAGLGVRPASGPDAGAAPWTIDLGRSRPGAEAVVRAVRGRERAEGLRVVDGTAGLGGDAGALVRAGMRVVAIERDPLLAALLEDALERWRGVDPQAAARLTLWHGDARDLLPAVRPPPDVVLLDPMFPAGGGGAKRRPAAWLRAWTGPRDEADEEADRALLLAARRAARRRIVVKRPRKGPELAPGPTGRRQGTTVRFDLYPPLRTF